MEEIRNIQENIEEQMIETSNTSERSSNNIIIEVVNELITNVIENSNQKIDDNTIKSNIANETKLNQEPAQQKFYENLINAINIQENILNLTSLSKEKITTVNSIGIEQLQNFKENYTKYGKYFKLIQTELAGVADLIK